MKTEELVACELVSSYKVLHTAVNNTNALRSSRKVSDIPDAL